MDRETLAQRSRRLRAHADAILGAVWYMPERATGFTRLGLGPAASSLGSRAACMGRVTGPVTAAAFGCLNPEIVTRAIEEAWSITTPQALLAERLACARRYLTSIVGSDPDGVDEAIAILRPACERAPVAGHVVFAGLRSQPWPEDSIGCLWRACDMVRERRGDSHVNAWQARGIDEVAINVLSEMWRRLPRNSVAVPQMGWSQSDADAALDRLAEDGLATPTGTLTTSGQKLRDEIEYDTDRQELPVVAALGEQLERLLALLRPWAQELMTNAAKHAETYATMRGPKP